MLLPFAPSSAIHTFSSARPNCSSTSPTDCPDIIARRRSPSFPATADEALAVVRELARHGVPFVPRGAGTGLSGGALADGAVLLGLQRLKRIIDIDPVRRVARVEPGVVNVTLTKAATRHGLHYAPDPSSQTACTLGGNLAENAGGPHCLKYGVTLNHVVRGQGRAARRRSSLSSTRRRRRLRPAWARSWEARGALASRSN